MKQNLYLNFLLSIITVCIIILTIKVLTNDTDNFELVSYDNGFNYMVNRSTGEIRHFLMLGEELIVFQQTSLEDLDLQNSSDTTKRFGF